MYREEDIEIIKLNIDDISDKAMYTYKSNNEPTYEESNNVYKVIIDYIKNKKKIVYGGYAQNKLIIEESFEEDMPTIVNLKIKDTHH